MENSNLLLLLYNFYSTKSVQSETPWQVGPQPIQLITLKQKHFMLLDGCPITMYIFEKWCWFQWYTSLSLSSVSQIVIE